MKYMKEMIEIKDCPQGTEVLGWFCCSSCTSNDLTDDAKPLVMHPVYRDSEGRAIARCPVNGFEKILKEAET